MFEDFEVVYVEDDLQVRRSVMQSMELGGLKVRPFESAETALQHIAPGMRGIVVTDVRLLGMDGLELLRRVAELDCGIPVILVTSHGDITMAVGAMREGAYDFLEKPFSTERLIEIVFRALEKRSLRLEVEQLRLQLNSKVGIASRILGDSPAIQALRAQIINLASTSADVLIFGETGTGKELVARCLHDFSRTPDANYVAINCGGLPESLFESEIFGHEAGAFTSAGKRRIGKFEHAKKGTILLDEIESMQMPLQIKLLRALQERKIERLGSNAEVLVDCRVVAATKADLRELSQQGKFRSDLYYRLSVAILEIPPLRDRREDIPMLFEQFVLQAAARYGREAPQMPGHMPRDLMAYDWPGNIRELRNVADRFVLGVSSTVGNGMHVCKQSPLTLREQMDQVEKTLIEQALKEHGGRAQVTSDALGIGKKTLYDKINRYAISREQYRVFEN
ncbi:MAG: sigma-54-dependent Fis family transcriptional regulator [Hyphomicrobiales bacterium]|nr:MAG: sigma-54-dependent Fis family transcriptional regulator [Hyphomicrobiales bacterium]